MCTRRLTHLTRLFSFFFRETFSVFSRCNECHVLFFLSFCSVSLSSGLVSISSRKFHRGEKKLSAEKVPEARIGVRAWNWLQEQGFLLICLLTSPILPSIRQTTSFRTLSFNTLTTWPLGFVCLSFSFTLFFLLPHFDSRNIGQLGSQLSINVPLS